MEGSTVTVSSVLTTLTSLVTSVVSVFGSVIDFVTDNPLMLTAVLLPVAVAFIPKGISLLKRATGKRRI